MSTHREKQAFARRQRGGGVYRHDKRRAFAGQWRVPEATLHLAEFAGGWPGAFLAQRMHKFEVALPEKYRGEEFRVVLDCRESAKDKASKRAVSGSSKVTALKAEDEE